MKLNGGSESVDWTAAVVGGIASQRPAFRRSVCFNLCETKCNTAPKVTMHAATVESVMRRTVRQNRPTKQIPITDSWYRKIRASGALRKLMFLSFERCHVRSIVGHRLACWGQFGGRSGGLLVLAVRLQSFSVCYKSQPHMNASKTETDFAPLRAKRFALTDDQLRLIGIACVDRMGSEHQSGRPAQGAVLRLSKAPSSSGLTPLVYRLTLHLNQTLAKLGWAH